MQEPPVDHHKQNTQRIYYNIKRRKDKTNQKERKQMVRERSGNVKAEWVCGIDHKYKGYTMCNIFI